MKTKITLSIIACLITIYPLFVYAQKNEIYMDRDLCFVDEFPYVVDFEAEGQMPGCWEQDPNNDHDWIFDDDSGEGAYEGDYYAKFDHEEYGDIGLLVTPMMDITGLSSPKLTFWHSQQAYGEDQDELTVYYRVSDSDPWMVMPGGFFTEDIPTWTHESLLLPSPSATYQIGFEGYDDYGYGVRLDYIVISEEVCAQPTDLTVSNVTESTADLSWTPNGGETKWNLIISANPVDDFESASIIEVLSNPEYSIVGLPSNSKYYIYVQAECSEGDGSEWVETTVLTDCAWFVDLPLEENFEEPWLNWCWRIVDNDGDANTWVKGADHIDPFSGTSTAYGSGNQDDYLILPKIFLQDNYLLKWMDVVETSEHNNTYEILVSTTNSDLESFTHNLGSFDCTNTNWTQHIVSLNDFEGESIYVAFHQTYSSSIVHGFGIDDVKVVEGVSAISELSIINNISIWPNPANENINIEITLQESENINISIYDISGKEVLQKVSSRSDYHLINLDVSDFSKGIYFVKAVADDSIINERIVIE
jgi:hypothetical protein